MANLIYGKNCLGTLDITAKFKGMRKEQEFCVYPIKETDSKEYIVIQSETRIGKINLNTGDVFLNQAKQGGSYFHHLVFAKQVDNIEETDLAELKNRIFNTAGKEVGDNFMHVVTDNSGADKI